MLKIENVTETQHKIWTGIKLAGEITTDLKESEGLLIYDVK